ncbi:hypothetical protein SEA_GALACTICA_111 [Streptomyces phage Galactica]|nr:hypothetical protein SEA_GALACTICA_111 [Streptomyces phage Galactica]
MFGKKKDKTQTTSVPFVWNAEVILDRGPIDPPQLLNVVASATLDNNRTGYGDLMLEESAVNWIAGQVSADPRDLTVVSFYWSMLDDNQTATPPPPR